jgi:hypothetical protein
MQHTGIGERGGSRISTLFWLVVLAAVIYAGYNAGPAYLADFRFQDKLQELARMARSREGDGAVQERVKEAIRDNGLDDFLNLSGCKVRTSETSRTISCAYEREVKYLPGVIRLTHFTPQATAPIY